MGISNAYLVNSAAYNVSVPSSNSPTRRAAARPGRSSAERPSGHRSRPATVEHVIHAREDESPKPVASVSVEVWKKRARKRQNLIKAMATSQQLAAALAPAGSGAGGVGGVRGGGAVGGGIASPFGSGAGSDRSSALGWMASNGGQSTPPETERPLPHVKDVIAKQVRVLLCVPFFVVVVVPCRVLSSLTQKHEMVSEKHPFSTAIYIFLIYP